MSQEPELDAQTPPADDDDQDAEGHSLAMVAGFGALDRARHADAQRKKAPDEELKPLTKPFPSMKDETRK